MHRDFSHDFKFNKILLSSDVADYTQIETSNNLLAPFTSDPATHRQCFNVTITEDRVLEDTETFSLNLTLVEGSTVPVVVDPDTSVVEITDVDCKDLW